MRGEHCVAGASVLSLIALILLVFAHIGQVSPSSVPSSIFMVEVNIAAYGNALKTATNTTPSGLYDTEPKAKMGTGDGLRQYYRWGLYNACGYQKGGSGICNGTSFTQAFKPLPVILSDTPSKFAKQTSDIIPSSTFKDTGYNSGLSTTANWLIFIGSCLAALGFIVGLGLIKHRFIFLLASAFTGLSALLLLIGAAIWTAIISKAAFLNIVKVQYGANLGIIIKPGPSLYLTWVAFAMITLSVFPYVVACCTYRK